mgnify:CR=1 FL=1
MGKIVLDADGELALGRIGLEVLEHGEGSRRRLVLGTEAVTAAGHHEVGAARLVQRGDDVLVERLANGAGFLGAVEHGDLLDGRGQGGHEVLNGPRTVQTNLDQADLLTVGVQVIDDFLEGVAEGTHADDHAVGVVGAVVVEQMVAGTELGVHLVHVGLDDGRQRVVGAVAGLAVLEEDIAVLMGAASGGVLRVECVIAEGLNGLHVAHVLEVLVIPHGDLLDLMRGAEAIEEVEERRLAGESGKVGDGRKVHDLLDVALGEHGKAGLAAGHDAE